MLIITPAPYGADGRPTTASGSAVQLAGWNFHPSGFYRVSSCIQIRSAPFSNMLNPFQAILSCTVSIDDAPKGQIKKTTVLVFNKKQPFG